MTDRYLVSASSRIHAQRKVLFIAAFCCALLVVNNAEAQARQTLRQDARAVDVLNSAITAMGGQEAWSHVADATFGGTCQTPNPQGGPSLGSVSIRWITQKNEFRYEEYTDTDKLVYISDHGKPLKSSTSTSTPLSREYGQRRLPYHLPGLLMQTLVNDSVHTLTLEGEETLDGVQTIHLRTAEYSGPAKLQGTRQDWWLDAKSSLPIKVAYLLPAEDNMHYLTLERSFGSWTREGSILLPHQLTDTLNGLIALQACTIQSVQMNTNPAATLFEAR